VKYAFHLIPSGILHPGATCIIGNGVVVHLPTMYNELQKLDEKNVNYKGRLLLSDRAHLVFDFHQALDKSSEQALGENKIGTTGKGIGPAYTSKMMRKGLRVGDLQHFESFEKKLRILVETVTRGTEIKVDIEAEVARYREYSKKLEGMIVDHIPIVHELLEQGKEILVEGANATMLDIDFGTYPYVTSSNPSIGSVCTGLGIPPKFLKNIVGIVKAYTTRVGEGPFPTELKDDIGERIRKVGFEVGTTTGRPRRCGWFDLQVLKFTNRINGFSSLNLTKLDVMSGLKEIKIGIDYIYKGEKLRSMPSNLETLAEVEVQYETLPGWEEDISKIKNFKDLPENCRKYVLRLQELMGVHIEWIGVGPGRDEMIHIPRQ